MNRSCFLAAAGLLCPAAVFAQTFVQQAQQLGQPAAPGGRGGRGVAPNPREEAGKPFSATVTTQTVQTYVDGTHVSQSTVSLQYRDAEGRTRVETSLPGRGSSESRKIITIRDPVAGAMYSVDPVNRTVVKLPMALVSPSAGRRGGGGARGGRGGGNAVPAQTMSGDLAALSELAATVQARRDPNNIVEDLGTAPVNGVPARGTRITTIVPMGAIGNDKEFRSVSERWFSPDLNLLIKSVSTDPRFGTTTYELTNISRLPPDPALFQPPAGYTVLPN